jgi:Asp/Glu/hydantoin racemase
MERIKMKVGVIRVFTTDRKEILHEHGNIIEKVTSLQCVNRCIPDQPKGIHDEETERIAVPKIVSLAKDMVENDNVDGLVISCAADPALQEVREAVSVPVIGAGSAGALVARSISDKVGVLSITDDVPEAMKNVLGDRIVGCARPSEVHNTTDLLKPEGKDKARNAAAELIDKGAEVIVFACTGYATIGFGDILRSEFNVKVVNPVEIEGILISYFLKEGEMSEEI